MSDHYDFELTANLREDIPEDIVSVLSFLMTPDQPEPPTVPKDAFFSGDWKQWQFSKWVTETNPHSGIPICVFRRVYSYTQHEVDHFTYKLHLRFEGKVEVVFEVGLAFAEWLAQWSSQNEFVGYFKGERQVHPTLLYFRGGELHLTEVPEFSGADNRQSANSAPP